MFPIIAVVIVIIFTAKLILKGYKTEPVLLTSGLILMALTGFFDWGALLPSSVNSTNVATFDLFRYIQYLMSYRAASLGLMIMSLVGFAEYMTYIGADAVIVKGAVKPLSKIKNKNILLFFAYIVGTVLQLAVPSATALAVLLMVTLYPIMVGLGISQGSAAAVIASSLALTFTPLGVDAIRASEALHIDLMTYIVSYQAPTSLVAMLAVGLTHVFWQSCCDKKLGAVEECSSDSTLNQEADPDSAPAIYGILPVLPIIFAVIFSKLVIDSVNLDVTTIVFISMFIAMIFEGIRRRSLKILFDGFNVFMKGMGNAFSTVVFLLVAAGIFAYGIQSTGAITHLVELAKQAGMPFVALTFLFAVVVGLASIIMGSGNAAFLSFVEIIPTIAKSMNANPILMMLPIQEASALGRAASPVAACVIVAASGAKMSTFDIVKRTSIPVLVGFIIHFIAVLVLI